MNLLHRQLLCLKIWSFLGNQPHFQCHDDDTKTECFEDTGCFWISWPVFCTMCWWISLCSLVCIYSSDNNLKTPLRKTTELATGKEHPFEGPYSKQHFSSLHGLPTEQVGSSCYYKCSSLQGNAKQAKKPASTAVNVWQKTILILPSKFLFAF